MFQDSPLPRMMHVGTVDTGWTSSRSLLVARTHGASLGPPPSRRPGWPSRWTWRSCRFPFDFFPGRKPWSVLQRIWSWSKLRMKEELRRLCRRDLLIRSATYSERRFTWTVARLPTCWISRLSKVEITWVLRVKSLKGWRDVYPVWWVGYELCSGYFNNYLQTSTVFDHWVTSVVSKKRTT